MENQYQWLDDIREHVARSPLLVKTSLNARYWPKDEEVNLLPSETVPDQAMSVREIFRRYASGLPVAGTKQAYYDDDTDQDTWDDLKNINLAGLDYADRQALMEEYGQELITIREKIDQIKKSKEDAKKTDISEEQGSKTSAA